MKLRVLVVDDNPSIVEVFVAMLMQGGYDVVSAGGGKDALSLLEDERVDLILLDILMEPMNGWETLQHLKAGKKTSGIPVMMLTAKHPTAQEAEDYSPMIEDYIMKPITRRMLYSVIEEFFGRRKQIDEAARKAEERGVDQESVDEYRSLSRDIEIRKRLFRLLSRVQGLEGQETSTREELQKAIENMGRTIDDLEWKLQNLRTHFAQKGGDIWFDGG